MLIESQLDSLPYLDPTPSEDEVVSAKELIEEEFKKSGYSNEQQHPSLFPINEKSYITPLLQEELRTRERGGKIENGIDLDRYTNLYDDKGKLDLNRAFVALAYTKTRLENLTLLGEYGKNQWLIGNDQLEQNLKQLEQDLEEQNKILESIHNERKLKQQEASTTYEYLQTRWKNGLKSVVDVNVECMKLEQQIRSLRGEY